MKKIILINLIILLLLFSCKQSSRMEITNEYKIKVLSDILSDTLDLKFISTKRQLISNYPLMIPPTFYYYDSLTDSFQNNDSHVELISKTLEVDDTLYIKKQIKSNRSLDLNILSKYGYKIFDLKKYHKEGLSIDSINKIANDYNDNYKLSDYLVIDYPVFNKKLNKIYIRIAQGSAGKALILKKENGRWVVEKEIGEWVE